MSTDGPAFQLYEMFYKNLLFICLFSFNEILQVKWSPLWNILGSYSLSSLLRGNHHPEPGIFISMHDLHYYHICIRK